MMHDVITVLHKCLFKNGFNKCKYKINQHNEEAHDLDIKLERESTLLTFQDHTQIQESKRRHLFQPSF